MVELEQKLMRPKTSQKLTIGVADREATSVVASSNTAPIKPVVPLPKNGPYSCQCVTQIPSITSSLVIPLHILYECSADHDQPISCHGSGIGPLSALDYSDSNHVGNARLPSSQLTL